MRRRMLALTFWIVALANNLLRTISVHDRSAVASMRLLMRPRARATATRLRTTSDVFAAQVVKLRDADLRLSFAADRERSTSRRRFFSSAERVDLSQSFHRTR